MQLLHVIESAASRAMHNIDWNGCAMYAFASPFKFYKRIILTFNDKIVILRFAICGRSPITYATLTNFVRKMENKWARVEAIHCLCQDTLANNNKLNFFFTRNDWLLCLCDLVQTERTKICKILMRIDGRKIHSRICICISTLIANLLACISRPDRCIVGKWQYGIRRKIIIFQMHLLLDGFALPFCRPTQTKSMLMLLLNTCVLRLTAIWFSACDRAYKLAGRIVCSKYKYYVPFCDAIKWKMIIL